ncbi:hypothetical protein L6164_014723 [Bauhinia variegata]|uniref:Uncharacterized protein n=2 Tax=Bauhinia variegata TaxID=167791 RepID=A0ACB9NIE3_BAUVA|nr:hypothetical protein L6164_014723 [Bauhinia variegata]
MEPRTKLRENYASQSQPMHLQDNCLRANMREELPLGVPSSQDFLQDFDYQFQFPVNGYSLNPAFGVQTQRFDPYHSFNHGCSSPDFDAYEYKPFSGNNGSGHAQVMDNFQYESYGFNVLQKNNHQVDTMGGSQSCVPFNCQEIIRPMNFVIPDEVSCISSSANYHRQVGLNKNNKASAIVRRTHKVRNKSSTVKGQWTVDEDR